MTQPLVWIAEDDRELGELMVHIMQLNEVRVELIVDGQMVLDRLDNHQPDLLILDMHLPRLSGLDVLRTIRANPHWAQVKVALVSADAIRMEQAKDLADYLLVKPMSLDQVNTLIATLR